MNEDYETKLIGTLIVNGEELDRILDVVHPDHFQGPLHKKTYHAILELYEKNDPIEILSLTEKLGNKHRMDLVNFADASGVVSNLVFYAEKVREGYLREQLRQTCMWGLEQTKDGYLPDMLLDELEGKVFSLAERKVEQKAVAVGSVIPSVYDRIMDGKKSGGLQTGFYEFDQMTGGLMPGDNVVVAGRPSMGKSALVISCLMNLAKENIPSAILTLETTREQITNRLLSAYTRIPLHRIRKGMVSNDEKERLKDACAEMHDWPIYIDDSAGITTLELRAKARRVVARYHPKLLAIDYLQLIHGSHRYGSRNEEVAEISHTIQGLAKELDIPIISVSQLSRRTEHREDKRPCLADLRDSGTIEQDATAVVFIYRPEAYKIRILDGKPTDGLAFIEIAKQKDGPTGEFKLTFLKDYALFENYIDYPE